MGIDHGLGGKDNQKSQQKRLKKAVRNKAIAQAALVNGKKVGTKEVVFDEKARVEWLTGFRKRKQERRKFGLAMQVLKDKKAHKATVKEQRGYLHSINSGDATASRGTRDGSVTEAGGEEVEEADEEEEEEPKGEVTVYVDEGTKSMFGGAVSVCVDTTGIAEEMDEEAHPDLNNGQLSAIANGNKRPKKELTKLERALKQAGHKLVSTKKGKPGASGKGAKKASKQGFGGKKAAKAQGGGKQLLHKVNTIRLAINSTKNMTKSSVFKHKLYS